MEMEASKRLPWRLIVGLGALGLIRPLLSMAGVNDRVEGPWIPLIATTVIAVAWIIIVVRKEVAEPLLTLVFAGVAYGILAILLNLLGQVLLPDARAIPPAGIVAIIITNSIWGALLGLIAMVLLSRRQR